MRSVRYLVLALAAICDTSLAQHGMPTLGAISLDAPGAPLETSSSATLGQGSWLTAYVTHPTTSKVEKPDGVDSRGLTDLSVGAVISFKYDDGF